MIKIPTIEMVAITKLKTDKQNPNVMEKRQFEALKKNITEFGFLVPVITNKDFVIADGENRWKAAIELGMKEIPILKLKISEIDRRILRQVMNKLRGEHEKQGDIAEFMRIYEAGEMEYLKDLLALDQKEMSKIMDSLREPVEDEAPPVPEATDIKIGDIFTLGNHRLMCGDSTNEKDVEKLMDGKKADMAFTDPPYGVNYGKKNEFLNAISPGNRIQTDIKNDTLTKEEMQTLWVDAFKNANKNLKSGGVYYVCGVQGGDLLLLLSLKESGLPLKHGLVWVKNNIVLGRSDYNYQHENIIYGWKEGTHFFNGKSGETSVWMINKSFQSKLYPTMKPIELVVRALKNSSKENDIVLDLFGGSGSTLIACEQLNRSCRMMEIDPLYVEVIRQRWEAFMKKKAARL